MKIIKNYSNVEDESMEKLKKILEEQKQQIMIKRNIETSEG